MIDARSVGVALPGAAAVALGALYASGSVVKAGQLRDAELNVRDTLPLVPLEQILGLGIGVLVTSLLYLVGFGAVLAFFLRFRSFSTPIEPLPADAIAPKKRKMLGGSLQLLVILIWVGAFWFFPPLIAVSVIIGSLLPEYLRKYGSRGTRYIVYVMAIYFAAVLFVKVLEAYYEPTRLPYATLSLGQGEVVRGPLITATGTTWYVAGPIAQTFRGVPSDNVESAHVVSRRAKDYEITPPLRALWNRLDGD